MTIYLYSGTPGSGKSLHATADIKDALFWRRYPRDVICNYDLALPESKRPFFHYKPNSELHPSWLVDFSKEYFKSHKFGEDKILLVIDECQLLFNSREWNNPERMAWLEFFSQHRHYGYKVIFVAQSDKMVDRQFRALIEYDVNHRKLSNFGLVGALMSLMFLGRLHVAVTRYYGLSERVGVHWFVARKGIFKLYDSYTSFRRTGSAVAGGDTTGGAPPDAADPVRRRRRAA